MSEKGREKLKEAEFFLEKMESTKHQPEFRYFFSAFLSASRSVTFYLQKENRDTADFDEWYKDKQEEMRESDLFNAMLAARNYTLKEDYPKTYGMTIDKGSDHVESVSIHGENINIATADISSYIDEENDEIAITAVDILIEELGSEYPHKSLSNLCREYLEKLEILLDEWESVRD